MKKIICALFIVSFFILTEANADELKIGIINVPMLLEKAPQAKIAQQRLEKEFAPKNTEILNLVREIKGKEERLGRDGDIMSPDGRRELEREIISGKRDVQRIQAEFKDDLNMRKQDEMGKLQKKIMETILSIVKQEGYDLIVGEGVIYADDKINLTNRILEELEKANNSDDSKGKSAK